MGKFSKHLGESGNIIIDGEEFILKPLTIEYAPKFFKIAKAFSGINEGKTDEDKMKLMNKALEEADESVFVAIGELISVTLHNSYPEEDKEEMDQFGLKYMSLLFPKIMEINNPEVENEKPKTYPPTTPPPTD